MAFVIDISNASSEKLGNAHGLSRQAFMELSPAFAQIHSEISQQVAYLPHLNASEHLEQAQELYQRLSSHEGPLVVLGDAGVVSALRAHSDSRCATWISDPSPDALSHLTDMSSTLLLIVDGPSWVRDVAQALSTQTKQNLIFVGDGSAHDGWFLDGADVVEEDWNSRCEICAIWFTWFGIGVIGGHTSR